MTVFIWESIYSDGEDSWRKIQGVYFEEGKAQEDVDKYEAFLEIYKNTPEPIQTNTCTDKEFEIWQQWNGNFEEAIFYFKSIITKQEVK
jgi:tetratricopeptide (TPR) repeat protein